MCRSVGCLAADKRLRGKEAYPHTLTAQTSRLNTCLIFPPLFSHVCVSSGKPFEKEKYTPYVYKNTHPLAQRMCYYILFKHSNQAHKSSSDNTALCGRQLAHALEKITPTLNIPIIMRWQSIYTLCTQRQMRWTYVPTSPRWPLLWFSNGTGESICKARLGTHARST